MSLDERMRVVAREVVEDRADVGDLVAGLQQQITDLREHLHIAATAVGRLEDRVEALEAAAPSVPTTRRATRKESGDKHT